MNKFTGLVLALVLGAGELGANAQDLSSIGRDEQAVEPIRTYASGYNVAKAEGRPLLVLVTTKPCLPCRVAKRLIEDMRDERALGNCVLCELPIDAIETKKLFGGAVFFPPKMIVLDMQTIGKSGEVATYAVSPISRDQISKTVNSLPSKLEQPTVLDEFIETIDPPAVGDRVGAGPVFTFAIATEYTQGYYNGTFAFGSCEYAVNSITHYKNMSVKRVNSNPNFWIIQARTNGPPGAYAWTSGNKIRVSPTARFVNEAQCNMVIMHELGHVLGLGHSPQNGGLMGPNGGFVLLPFDVRAWDRWQWKSDLRPWAEPEWFRAYIKRNAVLGDEENPFPLMNGEPSTK
jgi:hypothetical protein